MKLTDQQRWHLWLAAVAVIVIGSLGWFAMLPPARLRAYEAARVTPAVPDVSAPAYPRGPIDAAESSGLVWVNTSSGVYHYPGYRWFGRTIRGKFTSEQQAIDEGDRAALNERRPIRSTMTEQR